MDPHEEEGRPACEAVRPFELVMHFRANRGVGHDEDERKTA